MSSLPRPSELELAILRVLWRRGPSTVRVIFEDLKKERELGYNTILKTMLILLDKGLILRDESRRSHVYRTVLKERETQAGLLQDLVQKAFGGSVKNLVLTAIKESRLTLEETAEIRDFSILRSRSDNPRDLRSSVRVPLGRPIQLWGPDPRRPLATAVNLSRGGLLVRSATPPPVGSPCELGIARFGTGGGGFLAMGTVVRSDAGGTAIRFANAINKKIYEDILEEFSAPGDAPLANAYLRFENHQAADGVTLLEGRLTH